MNTLRFWVTAFLAPVMPLYVGGGGGQTSSQQATNTTTDTTNNVDYKLAPTTASDHAIALGGDGDSVTNITSNDTRNRVDNSGNTSTAFASDFGNTTSTNTAFASNAGNTSTSTNSGNTSTAFASDVGNTTSTNTAFASNAGNTSTSNNSGNNAFTSSTTNVMSDFGSVQSALDNMKATASGAFTLSDDIATRALGNLSVQSGQTMSLLGNLFDYAKTSSTNSMGTAMQALGLANNSTAQATAAVTSEHSSQTKMMMLAGAAIAAILLFRK